MKLNERNNLAKRIGEHKRGLKYEIVLFFAMMIKKYKLNEKKFVFTESKRKIAKATTKATTVANNKAAAHYNKHVAKSIQ